VFKKLYIFVQEQAVDGPILLDNKFINTFQRFVSSREDWSRITDYRSKLLDSIQTTTEPTFKNNPKVDTLLDQDGKGCTDTSGEPVKDSLLQGGTEPISTVVKQVRILMLTTDVIDIQQ
jgi:hypothetical protein